jgi:hydrogenase nickel incorporation protein HypA/HybF
MHELSVTEALLEQTLRHARAAQAQRITRVHVVIGQLAAIVDESVQFYWDLISHDTEAEGAQLNFRRVPAQFRCDRCGHDYEPAAEVLACPACGSPSVRLVSGDEFYLEALDIMPPAAGVDDLAVDHRSAPVDKEPVL